MLNSEEIKINSEGRKSEKIHCHPVSGPWNTVCSSPDILVEHPADITIADQELGGFDRWLVSKK